MSKKKNYWTEPKIKKYPLINPDGTNGKNWYVWFRFNGGNPHRFSLDINKQKDYDSRLEEAIVLREALKRKLESGWIPEKKKVEIPTYNFNQALDFSINKLENGKKVFIISMYQTMGAGQNLQFISPTPEKLINVKDENSENWNTQNETDINAIYLDKPTHIIQKIDLNLNEEGFIKYLFQLEFLAQVGSISIKQLKHQVIIAFKHLLASSNTTIKPESPNNGFLYKNYNIKQHFSKYIIQAIGRICRTNLKSPNIYIYADSELDKCICDFAVAAHNTIGVTALIYFKAAFWGPKLESAKIEQYRGIKPVSQDNLLKT